MKSERSSYCPPDRDWGWVQQWCYWIGGHLDWTGVDRIWMEWIQCLKYLDWIGSIRCRLLELQWLNPTGQRL